MERVENFEVPDEDGEDKVEADQLIDDRKPVKEGVKLTPAQRKFLLPHFTMILVGKPGSGKSTLLKKLVESPKYYKGKFDKIYIVSPSGQKLGIDIDESQYAKSFDINWIMEKVEEASQSRDDAIDQKMTRVRGAVRSHSKFGLEYYVKKLRSDIDLPSAATQMDRMRSMNANRFIDKSSLQNMGLTQVNKSVNSNGTQLANTVQQLGKNPTIKMNPVLNTFMKKKLNILFILDDVVSEIKKMEYDPRTIALFFNRRHLLENGTISIMLVTQKYTLIPARIRSNANWFILFKLNPIDFENVYRDVIMFAKQKWLALLKMVFQADISSEVNANSAANRESQAMMKNNKQINSGVGNNKRSQKEENKK